MNQKAVLDLITKTETPFLLLNVSLDMNDEKRYKGLIKGYNKLTYEECCNMQVNHTCNQVFFKVPDQYVVIDTDGIETNTTLKTYLKSKQLYDKGCITKSFRNITLKLKFKSHFWFRIKPEDKQLFNDNFSKVIHLTGVDIIHNSWAVSEFPKSRLDLENMPELSFKRMNKIYKLLGGGPATPTNSSAQATLADSRNRG